MVNFQIKTRESQLQDYVEIISVNIDKSVITQGNILADNTLNFNLVRSIMNFFNLKFIKHQLSLLIAGEEDLKVLRLPYVIDIVRFCLNQYKIDYDEKIKINFFKMDSGNPGSITKKNGTWYIKLDIKFINDDAALLYIISHEMAHYSLLKKNISLEPAIRNEELTDALVILAGFGQAQLMCKQKNSTDHKGNKRTVSMGYLSEQDIVFLMNIKRNIMES